VLHLLLQLLQLLLQPLQLLRLERPLQNPLKGFVFAAHLRIRHPP
jgi:hypothetical protein